VEQRSTLTLADQQAGLVRYINQMQLTCTRRSIEQEQNASLIDKWKRFQDEIEPERLLRLGRTVIQKDSSKEQSNLQLQLYV